ncbi:MAG TPA: hypothetical protein VGZ22_08850 [Isosphaeraceae bacterium]|jgi:hypothetical protein|nr:hypothetical protein [Isosphaeraceae bacterium]
MSQIQLPPIAMNSVRSSPTPLERALLKLDEQIDLLGGLPEYDVRPSAPQDRGVLRGLNRLNPLLGKAPRQSEMSRAEELLAKARSQWEGAIAASRPVEWATAADATLETLAELSDVIGFTTGRPSVLRASTDDVEAILVRALNRERRQPGKHEFYRLVRMTMPGLPSEAFGLASGTVGRALVERGFAEDGEPTVDLRRPILERAIEIVRTEPATQEDLR